MECFSFSELFEIPKANLSFRHGQLVHLQNQYAVFVFSNIREKIQFYQELQQSDLSESQEKKDPESELDAGADPCVIVMECGSNSMERYTAENACDSMVFANCSTPQDLLGSLRDILDNKSQFADRNLNTLVIENMSAFYWHQKSANSRDLYKEVNKHISQMMKRYACNVIVTMWSVAFERGFNSHLVDHNPQDLSQATFTPHELFKGLSVAFFRKQLLPSTS